MFEDGVAGAGAQQQAPWERVGLASGLLSERGFSSTIFEEMSALAQQFGAINLGQGFPDTDGPAEIFEAAQAAMAEGVNQYATIAGLPVLREAIAGHQLRFYGQRIDADRQITVTAGASEALSSTIAALVNPGDEVVVFEPFYDLYPAAVAQAGGVLKPVQLRPENLFQPDLREIEAAFTPRTRLVVVNDPHNPTGAVFSEEVKQKIAELAERHGAVILQDAVYEHLTFESEGFSPIFRVPGAEDRTVFVSAISKTHSLTGWRIGWMVGPAELIQQIRLVKAYFSHSAAAPLQVGAVAGINLGADFYTAFRERYTRQRDVLLDGLAQTPFRFVQPQGTFFAVADISQLLEQRKVPGGAELTRLLAQEAGVVAIPMTAFVTEAMKPAMNSWIRFAFCKQPPLLEEAVERLRGWL